MKIEKEYKITLTADEFHLLTECMEELSDVYMNNLESFNYKDEHYHNDKARAYEIKSLFEQLSKYVKP